MLRRTACLALLTLVAAACGDASSDAASDGPERAAYLTLMGDDTLAVEWMEFDGGTVEAQALIRGSRTTFSEYQLVMDESGQLIAYSADVYAGAPGGDLLRSDTFVSDTEGQALMTTQGAEQNRRDVTVEPGSVPFIDMLHWPFEVALRWQTAQGGLRSAVPTFTGRGMSFGLEQNADGSWALRHPSRGPSTVNVDEMGRITALDGTGSTRAYDLRRVPFDQLDPTAMRETFGDRPLGELSGRGMIDDAVAGVNFSGDYGAPLKRGRDIFGGLLSYGVWWRTGANAATQFSFDQDIVIDGVTIPAGDYSLSSIPEEDGGVLIINTRTGQGGQSYDEAMDQARVQMRREMLDETVEEFEIRVVPDGSGGRIEIRWDDTAYWVPFTVAS